MIIIYFFFLFLILLSLWCQVAVITVADQLSHHRRRRCVKALAHGTKKIKKNKKQKQAEKKTLQTVKPSLCRRCHTLRIRHVIAQISFRRIGQQIPCTPATRSACKSHTPRADFIYTVHDNHPLSESIPHAVYDGHNCSSRSLSAQAVDFD